MTAILVTSRHLGPDPLPRNSIRAPPHRHASSPVPPSGGPPAQRLNRSVTQSSALTTCWRLRSIHERAAGTQTKANSPKTNRHRQKSRHIAAASWKYVNFASADGDRRRRRCIHLRDARHVPKGLVEPRRIAQHLPRSDAAARIRCCLSVSLSVCVKGCT